MFEHILDCPQCGNRFHYECEGDDFPDHIACPECGLKSFKNEFFVVILCNECRSKLKFPLGMLNTEDKRCPQCGSMIHQDIFTHLNNSGTTLIGDINVQEKKRMLQDGDFFDKFKIIKLLGRGGMAEVYLAEHLLLKQKCALKLMQRTLDRDDNPIFIKRFVREAKLMHSLNHPNIVKVFDAGSDFKTGYLFLAMEYVDGESLHDIINQKTLSESELFEILTSIAGALKSLETAKVVHRDVKPSNIMYTTSGVYKLMDLGIAKMESNHQAGDLTLTIEQTTIGTPGYASPEQCSAAHNADIRSDIYSLGATLYHAASGVLPFTGDTPVAIILNMMQNDAVPLQNHRRDLSHKFLNLVEKMMKKDPDERFQNIDELLNAAEKVEKTNVIPMPVRKLGAAVTALGTTFWGNNDNGEKTKKKILRTIYKFIFISIIIVICAFHIDYFIHCFNSDDGDQKSGYSEFMKSKFHKKAPEKKSVVPVSIGAESLDSRLKRMHPLIPDPDKNLRPERNLERGLFYTRYPQIALTAPIADKNIFCGTFNSNSTSIHNRLVEWCRDGMLVLNGTPSVKTIPLSTARHLKNWSVFMNLRLADNHSAGIFKFNLLDVFVYRGTLRIVLDSKYYVDTRIELPAKRWINLAISFDNTEGRINIISENLLLGSFFFPLQSNQTYSPFFLYSPTLAMPMQGEIDFLAIVKQSINFTPVKNLPRKALSFRNQRLIDGIALKYSEKTVVAPEKPIPEVKKITAAAPAPVPVPKTAQGQKTAQDQTAVQIQETVQDQTSATTDREPEKKKNPLKKIKDHIINAFKSPTQTASKVESKTPPSISDDAKAKIYGPRLPELLRWQPLIIPTHDPGDINEALSRSESNLARFSTAVRLRKESYEQLPDSVPDVIIDKRKEILDMASDIAVRWKKRIDNMKLRNQNINKAKRNRYSSASGHAVDAKISQYIFLGKHSQQRMKLGNQLERLIADKDLNPNLKLTSLRYYSRLHGTLLNVLGKNVTNSSDEQLLKTLLKRYPDPETLTNGNFARQVIEYGLPGKLVENAYVDLYKDYKITDSSFEPILYLLMDGATLSADHLTLAVRSGSYKIVMLFLAFGSDPNELNNDNETPLFSTYHLPDGEKFRELLLAAGADFEVLSENSKRMSELKETERFVISWKNKDLPAVKAALQSKKQNPNYILYNNQTLLTDACLRLEEDLVKLLLEEKADPNAQNLYHQSPLVIACNSQLIFSGMPASADVVKLQEKQKRIITLLLSNGANFINKNSAEMFISIIQLFQNKGELHFLLGKHADRIPKFQWERIFSHMKLQKMWNMENRQAVLELCPERIVKENLIKLCADKVKITPYILQKAIRGGLRMDALYSLRINSSYGKRIISQPLLYWLLISQQSYDVIKAALDAGAYNYYNRRKNSRRGDLKNLTRDERIRELLSRYERSVR